MHAVRSGAALPRRSASLGSSARPDGAQGDGRLAAVLLPVRASLHLSTAHQLRDAAVRMRHF
eukprot:5983150-Pleurochrysis_carterae.AAC.1